MHFTEIYCCFWFSKHLETQMTAMKYNINTNEWVIFYVFDSNIYLYQNMLLSVSNKYFHIVFNNIKDCGTHNSWYFLPQNMLMLKCKYRSQINLAFIISVSGVFLGAIDISAPNGELFFLKSNSTMQDTTISQSSPAMGLTLLPTD